MQLIKRWKAAQKQHIRKGACMRGGGGLKHGEQNYANQKPISDM